MNKIVLAIDSYKGCLSSLEVEEAAAAGIRSVFPETKVCCVPIADGGEGMMEVLVRLTGGEKVVVPVHDPLMRPVEACYGVLGDGVTAVVEMAQASGLPLLSISERNPSLTTTYGVGEILREVLEAGYKKVIVGLGGSATNDAGMGMMQALGAHFYDETGRELSWGCGGLLGKVSKVVLDDFRQRIDGVAFRAACDVENEFCGPNGAAEVFAPQKGADVSMVKSLDEGLIRFASVIVGETGVDVRRLSGAGAAGGLGGCLSAFFRAPLCSGIDLILEQIDFRRMSAGAALLVTGEGKADRQTLMGKVPMGVLKVGKEMGVDVALLSGTVDDVGILRSAGFVEVMAATPKELPLEQALVAEVAKRNVYHAAVALAKMWL